MQNIAHELTIIIPSYNCAKYLPRTLDSIFSQTMLPHEVWVIDDASPDNSNDIVRDYQTKHSSIKLFLNDINKGVNATVNSGFNTVATKYVMSLAADDWILPTFIEKSMALLGQYPQAGLCSSGSLIAIESKNNLLKPAIMPKPLKTPGYISPDAAVKNLLKYDSWFMGNAMIMNAEMVREFYGYRDELRSFSDNFLYRQISLKYGCCFIPESLSVWCLREQSYSQSTCRNLSQLANIMANYINLMEQQYKDLFTKKIVDREIKRWSFRLSRALITSKSPNFIKSIPNKIMACLLFAYFRPYDVWPTLERKLT
jgi:glycosyltransferase involved in cell wall biosynthesis